MVIGIFFIPNTTVTLIWFIMGYICGHKFAGDTIRESVTLAKAARVYAAIALNVLPNKRLSPPLVRIWFFIHDYSSSIKIVLPTTLVIINLVNLLKSTSPSFGL